MLHDVRIPGETPEYRAARDRLLEAELALRRQVEAVAAERRKLPLGGEVPEDYVFEGADGPVRLSELFGDQPTLILYNYMFGPAMERPCPMCTSLLGAIDGNARLAGQRVAMAVVARSPIARVLGFASERGWHHLRLVSSAGNTFNRDYHGEEPDGDQNPILNVFVRRDGRIHHFYATEALWTDPGDGLDPRHVDLLWPLWNLLDLTPEGRGEDWYPTLD